MEFAGQYSVDYSSSLGAVINMEFNHAVVDGLECTAQDSLRTAAKPTLRSLLPKGFVPVREHTSAHKKMLLGRAPDTAEVVLLSFTENEINVVAAAAEPGVAWRQVKDILGKVPEEKVPDDTVRIAIWQMGAEGPQSSYKSIKAPTWNESTRNYPAKVGTALERMTRAKEPDDGGKIILWHGIPGTGKTSAIRTLMREWKDWCTFHYIADPEKLFQFPSYLMEVGADDENEWRLVIAEDTDEFIRHDNKGTAGASLGRLLNFSDGILGQGANTLFLLTTNERVDRLHPALVRPGRCFAQVEFQSFTEREARVWLPKNARMAGDKTLAELYELTKGSDAEAEAEPNTLISTGVEEVSVGAYL